MVIQTWKETCLQQKNFFLSLISHLLFYRPPQKRTSVKSAVLIIQYPLRGASGSVVVSKLDKQTCKSELESHCVPHSFGLEPHLSKKLSKLLYSIRWVIHQSNKRERERERERKKERKKEREKERERERERESVCVCVLPWIAFVSFVDWLVDWLVESSNGFTPSCVYLMLKSVF